MYERAKYLPAGDSAVVMELGSGISPAVNRRIREITYVLEREKINGIVEIVPSYRSLMVVYDPLVLDFGTLVESLKAVGNKGQGIAVPPAVITEIPTLYGGEYGPDIGFVAGHNNLTVDEVIRIHSGTDYLIYMIGFTPGFPYLGGMSEKIEAPRLEVPRERITAGSVGIAGKQTGIYPVDSPGGWRIIGRTPVKLLDPDRDEPVLLKAGNYLRFVPVGEEEFSQIEKEVQDGVYRVKTYPMEAGDEDGV